ncbi:MAG: hypothetical protein KDD46_01365 [Bdellovibrionales bacterium]|nr:hypothetical protein [Bdellovibrionales bacterium]
MNKWLYFSVFLFSLFPSIGFANQVEFFPVNQEILEECSDHISNELFEALKLDINKKPKIYKILEGHTGGNKYWMFHVHATTVPQLQDEMAVVYRVLFPDETLCTFTNENIQKIDPKRINTIQMTPYQYVKIEITDSM